MMNISITNSNSLILKILSLTLFNVITLNPQFNYSEAGHTRLKNVLAVKYNVNCQLEQCVAKDPNKSAVNLFQVISSNPETTKKTNFIWSNIGGPPMVITTSSDQDSDLIIDWDNILGTKGSNNHDSSTNATTITSTSSTTSTPPNPTPPSYNGMHFNVTPDAAIGTLIEKISLFDDTDNSGLFTKDKPHIEIDWGQVIWDAAPRTSYQKGDFLNSFLRMRPPHKILGGDLRIKLAIPRNYKADRQQEVPHLKLNDRSLSVVIVADGLKPPATFKNARLALTMIVVVQTPSDQVSLDTDSESLISDEYTPGVFRVKSLQFRGKNDGQSPAAKVEETGNPRVEVEAETPEAKLALGQSSASQKKNQFGTQSTDKDKLGFLYWKEVAYTDRRKIISRTVDVYDQEVQMTMDTLPEISRPFYQYFKYQPTVGPKPKYKLYRFTMIFGKGESAYSSTEFTDFSFVLGLGAAPKEQVFSFLVKFVIFICFCLPLLVMLAGLGYLMLRRFRRGGDTELLLTAES